MTQKFAFNQTSRLYLSASVLLLVCAMSGAWATAASAEPLQVRGSSGSDRLIGKTVVIVGASSGFGRGVALKLSRLGANLVLAARRTDALKSLQAECGGMPVVVTADVTKESDVEQIAQTAITKFGKIDVWINAAGVGGIGQFDKIPLADHAQIVTTNLTGVINGSHFAVRQFRKQNHGTLINIASIVGKVPVAYYTSYTAAKYGVVGFDDALRAELKADGSKRISVCTVCPMPANTPFWIHSANYTGRAANPYPLMQPDKVINAIVKLVLHPRDNVNVGWATKMTVAMHWLMPRRTENFVAKATRKHQFAGEAPPVVPTSGSLFEPMHSGLEVRGNLDASE